MNSKREKYNPMSKAHSPLIILAMWLTALCVASCILYSCEKTNVLPERPDCPNHHMDSTSVSSDTTSQS